MERHKITWTNKIKRAECERWLVTNRMRNWGELAMPKYSQNFKRLSHFVTSNISIRRPLTTVQYISIIKSFAEDTLLWFSKSIIQQLKPDIRRNFLNSAQHLHHHNHYYYYFFSFLLRQYSTMVMSMFGEGQSHEAFWANVTWMSYKIGSSQGSLE